MILGLCVSITFFACHAYSQSTKPKTEEMAPDLVSALLQLLPLEEREFSQSRSDPDQIPTADTPDEAFLFYWERRANEANNISVKPTNEEEKRIFQALLKNPSYLPSLLDLFPTDVKHTGMVKSLYDRFKDESTIGEEWHTDVKLWLRQNSSFFRDELIRLAESSDDGEDDLIALAKLDWKKAEPIVRRLAQSGNNPKVVVANGILFSKLLESNKTQEIIAQREKLIRLARSTQIPAESRVKAFTALLENQWAGRDEWYLTLLRDPSLFQIEDEPYVYEPLSQAIWKNETHWIPLLAAQVGHTDRNVHDMATAILAKMTPSIEAFRPLLPCLTDTTWCKKETPSELIRSLDKMDLPECIPGLIWILENDPDESCRCDAADAISRYRDPRALPALKKLLPKTAIEIINGESIIAAILAC